MDKRTVCVKQILIGRNLETYYRPGATSTIVSQVFETMNTWRTLRLRDFAFMVFSVSQYPVYFPEEP